MYATNSHGSLTREKILHSGTPVWAKSPGTFVEYSRLNESRKADVVIVGAGVSGAFMAHALSRHFESVIVLDRRPPVHGSTSSTTAILQFEIDVPLIELRHQIGATKAVRAWQRSYRATQDLVAIVRQEKIRCELAGRNALYIAGNRLGARALHSESDARNHAGLPGEFLSGPAVQRQFGINRTAAFVSPKSAVANPVQLAAGLLRRSKKRGVRLFSPVEVADVMATKHGVMLDTGTYFIECRFCVYGYETLKGVPTHGAKITSSWAIASRAHARYPQWLDRTLLWESADP